MNYTYEYLPWRGVTRETMEFYNCLTKIDPSGKPISIGYAYGENEFKVRELESKTFYTSGTSRPGLFGLDKFGTGEFKYITITEGELDACSLYQVLKAPVVSVHSASSAVRDLTACRSQLNAYERVYLAFDNDTAGREALAECAKLFDYGKVFHVRFDRRKDANEYLQHGEQDELKKIWWNSKVYRPELIKSSLAEFKDILFKPTEAGIPYPFPTLTQMTYGIRLGESVLITAQEGVGKTEIMHAIEYELLKNTKHPVCAIFLEEPAKRHLQSLAGIHLQRPAHLPDGGCTDDEVYRAVESIVGMDDRLHVIPHFGSIDPDILLDTIRFLAVGFGVKYFLFDHLSMAISGSSEDDERRKIDYLCTRLEMMVQELSISLIMVCHVNDAGQTRGSRWPSKVAHVRIHVTRDVDSGSNVINLMIKDKNRFAGRTGPAGSYAFNPLTRCYTEVAANDNAHEELSHDRSAHHQAA